MAAVIVVVTQDSGWSRKRRREVVGVYMRVRRNVWIPTSVYLNWTVELALPLQQFVPHHVSRLVHLQWKSFTLTARRSNRTLILCTQALELYVKTICPALLSPSFSAEITKFTGAEPIIIFLHSCNGTAGEVCWCFSRCRNGWSAAQNTCNNYGLYSWRQNFKASLLLFVGLHSDMTIETFCV